jgi:serine/threonine protein kinase
MNPTDIVANKYQIELRLGGGNFGTVYRGKCLRNGAIVAMKFESKNTDFKLLKREASILKYLYDLGCREIPMVYWFGPHKQSVCLVMGHYECSLSDYIKMKTLSLKKIDNILVQYIQILRSVHTHFVIHRDIKPQNCMIKGGNMFLIDFGLATFYVDDDSPPICESKPTDTIVGSPKYVSYHVHCASRPTRRDDLISMGYIYIYLYCMELPWDSVHSYNEYPNELYILNDKNQQRKALKAWSAIQPICVKIAKHFEQYMGYCYQLESTESPNYDLCISFFTETWSNDNV